MKNLIISLYRGQNLIAANNPVFKQLPPDMELPPVILKPKPSQMPVNAELLGKMQFDSITPADLDSFFKKYPKIADLKDEDKAKIKQVFEKEKAKALTLAQKGEIIYHYKSGEKPWEKVLINALYKIKAEKAKEASKKEIETLRADQIVENIKKAGFTGISKKSNDILIANLPNNQTLRIDISSKQGGFKILSDKAVLMRLYSPDQVAKTLKEIEKNPLTLKTIDRFNGMKIGEYYKINFYRFFNGIASFKAMKGNKAAALLEWDSTKTATGDIYVFDSKGGNKKGPFLVSDTKNIESTIKGFESSGAEAELYKRELEPELPDKSKLDVYTDKIKEELQDFLTQNDLEMKVDNSKYTKTSFSRRFSIYKKGYPEATKITFDILIASKEKGGKLFLQETIRFNIKGYKEKPGREAAGYGTKFSGAYALPSKSTLENFAEKTSELGSKTAEYLKKQCRSAFPDVF